MSEALVEVIGLIPPCDAGALGLVRAELEGIEEIAPVRSEAKLVASELVSNAVRHSGASDTTRSTHAAEQRPVRDSRP